MANRPQPTGDNPVDPKLAGDASRRVESDETNGNISQQDEQARGLVQGVRPARRQGGEPTAQPPQPGPRRSRP